MAGRDLAAARAPLGADVEHPPVHRTQTRPYPLLADRTAVVTRSGAPRHRQEHLSDQVPEEQQERHAHILPDLAARATL
jgi:hypothetical protein